VGNGESINIYTDPWIPSSLGRRVIFLEQPHISLIKNQVT
jgi:hypothetical protein